VVNETNRSAIKREAGGHEYVKGEKVEGGAEPLRKSEVGVTDATGQAYYEGGGEGAVAKLKIDGNSKSPSTQKKGGQKV